MQLNSYRRKPKRWQILAYLFMPGILGLFGNPQALAADFVILKHQQASQTIKVSVAELESLSRKGLFSARLNNFLEQTDLEAKEVTELLSASIPDTGIPLGKTDIQFLLFELNKLVGDPFGREALQPLSIALQSAYEDQNMSFLELIRRYPQKTVGLNLSRLSRVYQDVDLFVQRISPLFNFLEDLLPDLVCDCQLSSDKTPPIFFQQQPTDLSYRQSDSPQNLRLPNHQSPRLEQGLIALLLSRELFATRSTPVQAKPTAIAINQAEHLASSRPTPTKTSSIARQSPSQVLQKVVMTFGPVRRSFQAEDLNQFAATGQVPSQWQSYLKLAKISPQKFRAFLTDQKQVNFLEIDQFLNSLLGEYALFHMGQLVQTPSKRANVQALRSSILLSAANDEQISLLEILQNYPGQALIIDAQKMLKFTKKLKGKGAVKLATANLEDVMVAAQSAIAEEVCNCIQPKTNEPRRLDQSGQAAQSECQKISNSVDSMDKIGRNSSTDFETKPIQD